jgi:PAS domain S-box-containing protein
MEDSYRKHSVALRIVGIYTFVGLLWIYSSDTVLGWLVQDPRVITQIAIYKGSFYVVMTSGLLFFLISRFSRDITASQRALKASESYLRTILDTEPECVKLIDADCNLLMMNPAGLDMIGADSLEQVKGQSVSLLVSAPYRSAFIALAKQVFQGTPGTLEFEIVGLKGRHTWLETHAVPYRNDQGEIVALLGITRDITDKKKDSALINARVRLSEIAANVSQDEMLQKALDEAETLTGSTISYLKLLKDNQTALKPQIWSTNTLLSIRAAQAQGRGHTVGSPELWAESIRDRKPVISDANKPLPTQGSLPQGDAFVTRELVVPIIRENRVDAIVGVCNKPFGYTDQDVELLTQFASIVCDVVLRKKSEAALRESEGRYRSLVENIPLGIALIDRNSRIVMVNSTQAKWFGHAPAWFAGRLCFEVFEKREEICPHCPGQVSMDSGDLSTLETETVRDDGTRFSTQIRTVPLYSGNGETSGFIMVVENISERKRIEEEHRQMEKQMLHSQKLESLGILAGGIAHDFNNILMSIMGNADLALMRVNKESPVVENLHQIEKASARAADLAKQMLAYSGRGKFVVENLDLNCLLEEMLHMLEVSISKRAVLRLNLTRPLPTVEVDATQVRQVVMNLVINASEAIGDKSGVIAITTGCMDCDKNYLKDVWLTENIGEGLFVFVEIADTGCGMNKETLARIFDPFFTTKFSGRGLGMAAVLGIVRGHKGAIKVYSELGRGTSFKILLPASGRPTDLFNHGTQADDWQGSGTVLLVDDEETVRGIGAAMLRELGYSPITADDGQEAIRIFQETPDITLVILDLTMPHMDGEQCFRELRRINPKVKVIISSGYNEQEVTQKFMGKGLAGFIQKPYKVSELKDTIRSLRLPAQGLESTT